MARLPLHQARARASGWPALQQVLCIRCAGFAFCPDFSMRSCGWAELFVAPEQRIELPEEGPFCTESAKLVLRAVESDHAYLGP